MIACQEKKDEVESEPIPDEKDQEVIAEVNPMMSCEPNQVITPEIPQEPSKEARAYFSDSVICQQYAIPFDINGTYGCYCDYVGAGKEYL